MLVGVFNFGLPYRQLSICILRICRSGSHMITILIVQTITIVSSMRSELFLWHIPHFPGKGEWHIPFIGVNQIAESKWLQTMEPTVLSFSFLFFFSFITKTRVEYSFCELWIQSFFPNLFHLNFITLQSKILFSENPAN